MNALTKDELLRLLGEAKARSERDYLLLLVCFSHGLRISEALSLTRANFGDGYLTVKRLKGSNKTTQPLARSSNPLLNEKSAIEPHLLTLSQEKRLFDFSRQYADRLIKTYGKRAGIPKHKLSMHKMKHTCAMLSIRTAGIENVKQYLGHRSLASTGAYLKVSDDAASLAFAAAMGSYEE